MFNPPHPGELLREWLEGHTVTEAASKLGVSRVTLSRVLNGAAAISAEMDVRLHRALGTTPGLWLNMQAAYDLWHAQRAGTAPDESAYLEALRRLETGAAH